MKRRHFIKLIGGMAAWPAIALGQQTQTVRRIGVLSPFIPSDAAPWHKAFVLGLRDLGWQDGANIAIEYRYAEGHNDRLPGLIADLIRRKVEIIVTSVTNDSLAARDATRDIPIVMAAPGDPVRTGLVKSLARPGGNVTGLSQMNPELNGKRLALIKELAPSVTSVAAIWNPEDPISAVGLSEIQDAAVKLNLEVRSFEMRNNEELGIGLDAAIKARVGAIVIMPNPVFVTNMKRIADFAFQNKMPTVFHLREYAEAGGLVSYGVDRLDLFRRTATYVDRILKGASPADLPIEQPTKFDLVINNQTAKALGLTVPTKLLFTADQVIE